MGKLVPFEANNLVCMQSGIRRRGRVEGLVITQPLKLIFCMLYSRCLHLGLVLQTPASYQSEFCFLLAEISLL